ncbi:MAG: ribulose-bisphosphate carboxylase large subunit family protein [Bacteroidota bacterium]
MERIKATYWIETAYNVKEAAAALAGEQSSGTFLRIPGESQELRERYLAKIDQIEMFGETKSPSLPGASIPSHHDGAIYKKAKIEVSWPLENIGYNLPNLMATVAGNLFELKHFSGLRLSDIEVPKTFYSKYPGPQFGIQGTQKLVGVKNRPVIGTIIKPSVGLSPDQTAAQVKELCMAGLDFFKDDELMGDPPHSPFEQRVEKVMNVINSHAQKTGKKPMYAFNLSGDLDDMLRRHDHVLKQGGTCIMVSLNWIGISALAKLRNHSRLPIHGHRNGWGLFSRSPHIGIDFKVFQKIWRMAGADQLHTNGLRNKFCEPDASVLASIRACQQSENGKKVMPVVSSGQWAGQTVDTYNAIGNADMMYLCGGGIMGHPLGTKAGVKSIQQGWEAALAGVSLVDYAKEHQELAEALDFFVKHTRK